MYWRSLMTLFYWEWHLIPNWPLKSTYAWFLEQLLKDLVSWGSPDECFMIDHFLRDAWGFLSCQFWSTVQQCGARLPILTLNYCDSAVSGAQFLTGGVFECDIAHHRSFAVQCMLYKIRCNPMHPLNDTLPTSFTFIFILSKGWLWGWSLVTDRVYITLSQPCTADLF